ncbi:MAG TPA: NADP-dependent oxidoreductase [Streptosporangiaceae bacterium]|nr:NADP-dependent oxidoreductase [Streptosporangiaceae bacterium]
MPHAVRFDQYGGLDVLRIADVDQPRPGPGQVVVKVKAAGINPGEAKIRDGAMADRFPATFPSGEGSDLAGVVAEVGEDAGQFRPGDEVIGFTNNRASHADFVLVEGANLVPRPANVSWEAAGGLFVAGVTAYAAVRAVAPEPGDTVVVAGAAGGVGSIAVQLAVNAGAKVIGLASETHHPWLAEHGVTAVSYGPAVADRIRAAAAGRADAFIDTVGTGYVELALELGVQPDRIDTIADFAAGPKYGVKMDGSATASTAAVLAELAGMIDKGVLEVPIAAAYPLTEVRAAYQELSRGHTRGKIVLVP